MSQSVLRESSMSICEQISVQIIDGSSPAQVIVPIRDYRQLFFWTDMDETGFQVAAQFIRDAAGHQTQVVLMEEDYLTLTNTWQVADDQRFVLSKGVEKGASGRALYCPDNGQMLVLKGSIMAYSEASRDFHVYSSRRAALRGENGPVQQIDGQWVFVRNEMFDDPSTAASVLAGYRIGAFEGWRPAKVG